MNPDCGMQFVLIIPYVQSLMALWFSDTPSHAESWMKCQCFPQVVIPYCQCYRCLLLVLATLLIREGKKIKYLFTHTNVIYTYITRDVNKDVTVLKLI